MTGMTTGAPPARSRQEVVELIAFLGQSTQELERIDAEAERQIAMVKDNAETVASQIKTAAAEAQEKVEAWFAVHPEAASTVPGGERFVGNPIDAQLAAVVLSSARPLTQRQVSILEGLQAGKVLRRINKHRSYSLIDPARPTIAWKLVNSNHVFDLQHRYLDAYDAASGERVLGVSAFEPRNIEFRIKPGVVLPC